jgi:hypothetical protein
VAVIATGAGGWQNHRRAGDDPIPPYLRCATHTAPARQLSQPLLGDPKRRGRLLDADKLTLPDHTILVIAAKMSVSTAIAPTFHLISSARSAWVASLNASKLTFFYLPALELNMDVNDPPIRIASLVGITVKITTHRIAVCSGGTVPYGSVLQGLQ